MTREELSKIPFHETGHMAMADEYTTTYSSEDGRLGWCDRVPRDPQTGMVARRRKAKREWRVLGEWFTNKEKFIEAALKLDAAPQENK